MVHETKHLFIIGHRSRNTEAQVQNQKNPTVFYFRRTRASRSWSVLLARVLPASRSAPLIRLFSRPNRARHNIPRICRFNRVNSFERCAATSLRPKSHNFCIPKWLPLVSTTNRNLCLTILVPRDRAHFSQQRLLGQLCDLW